MLPDNLTIGIFTSSYPITAIAPEATARAAAYLEANGVSVKFGALTGKQDHYRSGTIEERATEFNNLLYDPEINCLMASVGGMVSNAILPYIDYDYLKTHPKYIVGHSDVTALLLGIYQMTGLPTYYGPNLITTFGRNPILLPASFRCLQQVLFGKERPYLYPIPPNYCEEPVNWTQPLPQPKLLPNHWLTVREGQAAGRLIGGNLSTISGILGTPYMPQFQDGDILFLEDTEKFAAHAERYFSTLKLCGILDRAGGILLGKHRKFDDQGTGRHPADILLEVLGSREIPILADVDCCHTVPMLTLPIGGKIFLDAGKQELRLLSV